MKTIVLAITRKWALCAAAMPCRISVNGQEVAKLKVGGSCSCEISDERTVLRVSIVGNAISLHKAEKEVVLFPEYCRSNTVKCVISTKMNWLGFLTLGLFQAMARIEIEVEYQ